MPSRAKIYAFVVIAMGAVTLSAAGIQWTSRDPVRFVACLCLALLGSTFKVRLPGMEGCLAPGFVPLLFAAGTMSWQETVVMAGASGIVQTLWKAPRRPVLIQVLFNAANLAISMAAAFAVSHAVAPRQLVAQLAAAVMIFEVVNTLSVSAIICLVSRSSLSGVWRNCHLWTFPFHLAGAAMAAVWVRTDLALSPYISQPD